MKFPIGSFSGVCMEVPLPLCVYVGPPEGTTPKCYARSMAVFGYPVFQYSTLIMHCVALVMTTVMIFNIKTKYTAVGRKEIALFFYLYTAVTIAGILLDGNLIPIGGFAFPLFAAAHVGLVSAACWCLLLNGLVGFQFAEDGTRKSVWSIRISSALVSFIGFLIASGTFNNWAGLRRTAPTALWILYFLFNSAAVIFYIALQVLLVVKKLEDRWPLGDILFGTAFVATAQVCLYVVSQHICVAFNRYIDGMFFGTAFNLLAVMMVYKYWDYITQEDLEFSVRRNCGSWSNWKVKDLHGELQLDYHPLLATLGGQYEEFPAGLHHQNVSANFAYRP